MTQIESRILGWYVKDLDMVYMDFSGSDRNRSNGDDKVAIKVNFEVGRY